MKTQYVLEEIHELNSEALVPDGLEEAVIGYVERFGMQPLALVDKEKVINILMKRDKMLYDEAEEYFDFNIIGAWVGDGTPCFATIRK